MHLCVIEGRYWFCLRQQTNKQTNKQTNREVRIALMKRRKAKTKFQREKKA